MKPKREWTYKEWHVPKNLDNPFAAKKPLTKEQLAFFKQIEHMLKEAKWKNKKNHSSYCP